MKQKKTDLKKRINAPELDLTKVVNLNLGLGVLFTRKSLFSKCH